jgi:hypothetical protein
MLSSHLHHAPGPKHQPPAPDHPRSPPHVVHSWQRGRVRCTEDAARACFAQECALLGARCMKRGRLSEGKSCEVQAVGGVRGGTVR